MAKSLRIPTHVSRRGFPKSFPDFLLLKKKKMCIVYKYILSFFLNVFFVSYFLSFRLSVVVFFFLFPFTFFWSFSLSFFWSSFVSFSFFLSLFFYLFIFPLSFRFIFLSFILFLSVLLSIVLFFFPSHFFPSFFLTYTTLSFCFFLFSISFLYFVSHHGQVDKASDRCPGFTTWARVRALPWVISDWRPTKVELVAQLVPSAIDRIIDIVKMLVLSASIRQPHYIEMVECCVYGLLG